ncbi:hypothetical protein VTO42DRAFT_248 [Malbranchea cinnamomea]
MEHEKTALTKSEIRRAAYKAASRPVMSSRTGLKWMDGFQSMDPEKMPPLRSGTLVEKPTRWNLPPFYRKLPTEQVKALEEACWNGTIPKWMLGRRWPWNFSLKGNVRSGRKWSLQDEVHPEGIEVATFESCGLPMQCIFQRAKKVRSLQPVDTTQATPVSSELAGSNPSTANVLARSPQDLSDRWGAYSHAEYRLDNDGLNALRVLLDEKETELHKARKRIRWLEDYVQELENAC